MSIKAAGSFINSIELVNLLDTLSIYRREIIRSHDTSKLKLPVNITQERVLMTISKIPNLNMKELCAHIGLEKSSLTRVIDSLIDEGFVARTNDLNDRRKINCSLTKKGLTQANIIEKLMMKHIDIFFSDLSKDEKDKLIHNLSDAVDTLSKYFKKT